MNYYGLILSRFCLCDQLFVSKFYERTDQIALNEWEISNFIHIFERSKCAMFHS